MAAEPFSTQGILFGLEGIDLKRTVDLIKVTRCSRLTNVVRVEEGALSGREGINLIGTAPAGTSLHSIIRLTGSALGTISQNYVVLVDATIYWVTPGGVFTLTGLPAADSPSSPVIMIPTSFITSNGNIEIWAIIPVPAVGAGVFANLIVREIDGVCHSLGLQSQALAVNPIVTVTLDTETKKTIDDCDVAGWTNNAGTGGAPANVADAVIKKQGAASLKLTTNPGAAPAGYYNFWNKANALNLNTFGAISISDDDIIHLWIRTDLPAIIDEFRIYFVVTAAFDVNTIPGTSDTLNTDAYYKAFRPSDFTSIYEVTTGTTPGAQAANQTLTTLGQLPTAPGVNPTLDLLNAEQDPSIRTSLQMGGGRGAWQEVGIIGYPLRRGDFGRIGTDSSRTWANVTGLVLAAQINKIGVGANIWLDDIYVTGGAGPDTSAVGSTQYDYRYTHYCLETSEESNPSDIQVFQTAFPNIAPHDALRRGLVIDPDPYVRVDAGAVLTFRQRIYRRGGTLGNNWYFVGQNSGNGATFTDTLSDLEIVAAPTLQIDNDMPPPLASIWGPVNGILFGCMGNTTTADLGGTLFWSKVDSPGAWPASYTYDVCSASEELMAGFAQAGQAFVFSREALYTILPDLSNAAIMNVVPTQCKKGLTARCAFVAYQAGVFFLAKDGIYFSAGPGGAEKNITDDVLEPIFRGETKYGYQPIDWTQPDSMSMEIHESEVWFLYQGLGSEGSIAAPQIWIYNTLYNYWRNHAYGEQIARVYSEPGQDLTRNSILLVGSTGPPPLLGYIPSESTSGFDMNSQMSDCHIRTGALDQGIPRVSKLYGDAFLDVDDNGNGSVTVTPYVNNDSLALTATTISPAAPGRQRFYIPIDEILARNISLDISWTPQGGEQLHPIIYQGGVSYTPQPDTTETRVTNWDTQGRLNDKWVKGILYEVDTGGIAKSIDILADGAVVQNISVLAAGRKVLQFSWPEFKGRILRTAPTDTVQWIVYDMRWIFDEEPLELLRWESQEVDHGFHGQQVPLFAFISLRSTANVNLRLTTFRQDGTSLVRNYTIPSTGGAKQKPFVPFLATRGVLFKYLFTSEEPFALYREESTVRIQPWGQGGYIETAVFGDDDLDQPMRNMIDAGQASARSGAAH